MGLCRCTRETSSRKAALESPEASPKECVSCRHVIREKQTAPINAGMFLGTHGSWASTKLASKNNPKGEEMQAYFLDPESGTKASV